MFTIKQTAARVGVEASTLRAWEQRYGVVSPRRSQGGYRVYDETDVARLRSMARLISEGWSAAQAAEQVKTDPPPAAVAGAAGAAASAPALDPQVLARCGEEFDAALLTRALDEAFGRSSFEHVVAEWVLPGLAALGEGWVSGRVTIAGEHFVTAAIQRRLAMAYEAAGNPVGGPLVLVGLPPESRHELGVLIFATLLRRLGVRTRYVGADLPVEAWAAAVQATEPAAVVLAAPMDVDAANVQATVEAVREALPEVPVQVGGASQDDVDGVERLGHDLIDASRRLAARLQGLPQTAA